MLYRFQHLDTRNWRRRSLSYNLIRTLKQKDRPDIWGGFVFMTVNFEAVVRVYSSIKRISYYMLNTFQIGNLKAALILGISLYSVPYKSDTEAD
jgi:hypothetical protein